MASGLVRMRRSLLPRRSRGQSLKRSPRKSASLSFRFWMSVPMAPSRTRMRFAAVARRRDSVEVGVAFIERFSSSRRFARDRLRRPEAEQVADGVDEVGAVHRVEMEVGDAAVDEVED